MTCAKVDEFAAVHKKPWPIIGSFPRQSRYQYLRVRAAPLVTSTAAKAGSPAEE
jgi:hypothetical protein